MTWKQRDRLVESRESDRASRRESMKGRRKRDRLAAREELRAEQYTGEGSDEDTRPNQESS